jgi:hypothetical protein
MSETNDNLFIPLDNSYEKYINFIMKNINLTKTKYGTLKLYEILHIMLINNNLLKKRQNIIQNIVNNKFITTKIEKIFEDIDDKIIYSWFEHNFDNEYYLTFNLLNIPFFLTLKNKLHYFLVFLSIISIFILYYTIKSYSCNNENNILKISILFAFLTQIIIIIRDIVNSYKKYSNCSEIFNVYQKIVTLITTFDKIAESDIFLIDEKMLVIPYIKKLKSIFDINLSLGDVLLLRKNKTGENEIGAILQYIGILDVFIMISKLIETNEFCIPSFDFQHYPILNISNVWNPTINNIHQTKNDINIDDCLRYIILSGDKLSGKTNYSNAILSSVILSQTLGIAPCSEIKISPIHKIISIFNNDNYIEKINELKKIKKDKTLLIIDNIYMTPQFFENLSKFLEKHTNIIGLITTNYQTKLIKIKCAEYVKFSNNYVIYKGKKIKTSNLF